MDAQGASVPTTRAADGTFTFTRADGFVITLTTGLERTTTSPLGIQRVEHRDNSSTWIDLQGVTFQLTADGQVDGQHHPTLHGADLGPGELLADGRVAVTAHIYGGATAWTYVVGRDFSEEMWATDGRRFTLSATGQVLALLPDGADVVATLPQALPPAGGDPNTPPNGTAIITMLTGQTIAGAISAGGVITYADALGRPFTFGPDGRWVARWPSGIVQEFQLDRTWRVTLPDGSYLRFTQDFSGMLENFIWTAAGSFSQYVTRRADGTYQWLDGSGRVVTLSHLATGATLTEAATLPYAVGSGSATLQSVLAADGAWTVRLGVLESAAVAADGAATATDRLGRSVPVSVDANGAVTLVLLDGTALTITRDLVVTRTFPSGLAEVTSPVAVADYYVYAPDGTPWPHALQSGTTTSTTWPASLAGPDDILKIRIRWRCRSEMMAAGNLSRKG